MMDKRLNLLGIAQVAGGLVSGTDTVLRSIQTSQATLVIVATDASQRTKKSMRDKCQSYDVDYVEVFSTSQLSSALGKKRTLCAFTNQGFKKSFMKHTKAQNKQTGATSMSN
ncbi:MAG: ribosomal L7Ae/L30e/S12e/Gadd45 family protein [Aerococcus sp.]|nr:ribosomal L7Ae/L30e/S12e/Gadd45 family protein [Aerococcus sp.]